MSSERQCPDGGKCHHECNVGCWRVANAGPLSGVYVNDEWPASVVPVEPDYEVTYCPVHDVLCLTWPPVNHERCGLIVLAHDPEIDDE